LDFDRGLVKEYGFVESRGALKEGILRVRVQTYDEDALKYGKHVGDIKYGPFMVVFDLFVPENPRSSKPLFQAHLTGHSMIQLIAFMLRAYCRFTGKNITTATSEILDIWRGMRR
jgi:hypothetical protein